MTDRPLTPEREQNIRRWRNKGHCYRNADGDALLAEIDRLRADLAAAREALERAASGLREAYDYGCTWPIGIDTEPQEQRGMERDTFIRNMELLERVTRGALDRIGEQ